MTKPAVAYICNNLDFQDNYTQRKLITKFSTKRDFVIERWFEDTVEQDNKFSPDRKAMLELMEWAKNHKSSTVIMVGMGRMTLDFDKFIEIQKIFEENDATTLYIECELTLNEEELTLMETVEKALSLGEKKITKFDEDK